METIPQPSPSEQRMQAVARLKRAASLPRMKDGRRPPMHPEAVSEGEKAPTDEEKNEGSPSPPNVVPPNVDAEAEEQEEEQLEREPTAASPSPQTRHKRRSRSRSRSRGSKDFKGKVRPSQSPTPVSMAADTSQDESPVPQQSIPLPLVFSPVPHLAAFQNSQLLTPTVPEPYMFYPGTPGLPSLDAIQRGLFRSNSTAGTPAPRAALQRQAGEAGETPATNRLGRNNTVSGGDRFAARQNLFTAINSRIAEAENGKDEIPRPTSAQKRKRRRSRRGSTTVNAAIEDSGALSTTSTTPLPQTPLLPANNTVEIRSRSATPGAQEGIQQSIPVQDEEAQIEEPRRRSLVIEEEEDDDPTPYPDFPITPLRNATPNRAPHSSDPPLSAALSSEVPIILSHRAPSRTEPFPSSPFTTPLKEPDYDGDITFQADTEQTRTYSEVHNERDREMSWIPDAGYRIPVHHEDDDDEGDDEVPDEDAASTRSSNHFPSQETYENTSPRHSNGIIIETESYPESPPSQARTSPLPPQITLDTNPSNDSPPATSDLNDSSNHLQISVPESEYSAPNCDLAKQGNEEPSSPSTWEKMVNSLIRTASNSGRRSRSNSIINKRDQPDTAADRESGTSLSKADPNPPVHQALMLSPSASASISSLAPYTPTRGAPSPMPSATPADMHRYQDAKLFPFPGIHILEQRRNKERGNPLTSASVPDVANLRYSSNDDGGSQSFAASPSRTPEITRERKLSHQASESRIVEYLNITKPATNSSSSKLPMSLPAVRQWLTKNKNGKKNASVSSSPSESKSPGKKALLADFLRRRESELGTDWEDISTPTSTSGDTLLGRRPSKSDRTKGEHTDIERTPKAKKVAPPLEFGSDLEPFPPLQTPTNSSVIDPHSSATPDPVSSLSDYPAPTSESSSRTSSNSFLVGAHGAQVLQRLEECIAQNPRVSFLSAVDDPPRKLILSSPVLQVVNSNTVKDRLLFLFTDVLIIAKPVNQPVSQDQDPLRSVSIDKRCVVKSVVMLRDLRLGPDRGEFQPKVSNNLMPRSSLVKTFVVQFAKDPDQAVATLFAKSGVRDDPIALGQLLFRAVDLDRTKLGEYLSKRSTKPALKAYLDSFGYVGLRVDQALRVFLLSVHIPAKPISGHSPLDYLLDQFSSRWYEANATFVAYDRDLAIRLVRALVQLNDLLHGGVAQEPGPNTFVKQDIPSQLFADAFRKADPRYFVSDDHLEDLYHSIRLERLSQARCSSTISSADQIITIKRPLPTRLTYKVQSDPIILRISQPDPQLIIQLYGQDLVFDPPVLTFSKSSEVSFRVMGTSLGQKTMVMCRSGLNALKYSGLPLSCPLAVERAFMKNTFQIAFANHLGVKRRYMFSVDDLILRQQWMISLKMHVESAVGTGMTPPASLPNTANALDFFKASQRMSYRVLQETLTGVKVTPTHRFKEKVNGLPYAGPNGRNVFEYHEDNGQSASVTRSKSRSKYYHKYGAGKNELDLKGGQLQEPDRCIEEEGHDEFVHHEGPTWTTRELEIQCQQNSVLASVLALLLFTGQETSQ
ncbi:hypothetical protein JOM56_002184 [Amanita muscaria]